MRKEWKNTRQRRHIPNLCSIVNVNGYQHLITPKGEMVPIIKSVVTDDLDLVPRAVVELHVNIVEDPSIFDETEGANTCGVYFEGVPVEMLTGEQMARYKKYVCDELSAANSINQIVDTPDIQKKWNDSFKKWLFGR